MMQFTTRSTRAAIGTIAVGVVVAFKLHDRSGRARAAGEEQNVQLHQRHGMH